MKLYIVRIFDTWLIDNDSIDSYWLNLEKANARVKELNESANEEENGGLYFDILIENISGES